MRKAGSVKEYEKKIGALEETVSILRKRIFDISENERRYYNIIMNAPLPCMIYAEDGEVVMLNDAWSDISGYTGEDLSEVDDWLEMAYIDRPDVMKKIKKDLKNLFNIESPVSHGESAIVTKFGDRRIWDFNSSPLGKLADGRRILITMVTDVTERVEVEEALAKSEENYRMVAETVPCAIYSCAFDEQWTMNYVGPQIKEISGYPFSDFIDNRIRSYVSIIHPDDQNKMADKVSEKVHTDDPWKINYRLLHADGSVRFVYEEGRAVRNTYGEVTHLVGFVFDETERKKAEEEKKKLEAHLKQTQKMETLGTLASGIAHDFNNTLMPIMGFADMGRSKAGENTEIRRCFDKVLESASRAGELVEQLLTFSRGKEVEKKSMNFAEVVRDALGLVRHALPSSIVIKDEVDTSSGIINGNPVQIHQIVVNLCTNAFNSFEYKGEVTVIVCRDDKYEHENNKKGFIKLTVKDNGKGMDRKTAERASEPFFTTKKDNGVGLGLSVVHGIVSDHGGDMTISSKLGEGTSVDIYFPLTETFSSDKHHSVELSVKRGNESVLLLDDNENVAEITGCMLSEMGYKTSVYTDSESALKKFREFPENFDIVISDITMPELTGPEFVEKLRDIRPNISVIYITGYGENPPEYLMKKKAGKVTILKKPLLRASLSEALRKMLDEE